MTGKEMATQETGQQDVMIIEEFSAAHALSRVDERITFIDGIHRRLIEGKDYAKRKGYPKPSLELPGAEKILAAFNCAPEIVRGEFGQIWDSEYGLKEYSLVINLIDRQAGKMVGSGVGYAKADVGDISLHEKDKNGRWIKDTDGSWKMRLEITRVSWANNKALKMAYKSALICASKTISALSGLFTQDLEGVADPTTEHTNDKGPKFEQRPQESSKDTDKTPPPPESESTVEENAKASRDKTADLQAKMNEYSDLIKELQMLKLKPASQTTAIVSKAIAMGEDWDGKIEFLRAEIMERKEGGNNGT